MPKIVIKLTLLFASIVLLGCEFPTRKSADNSPTPTPPQNTEQEAYTTLADSLSAIVGLTTKAISYSEDSTTITVWVPGGKPLEVLTERATMLLKMNKYTIVDAFHNTRHERTRISVLQPKSKDTLYVRIRRKAGYYENVGSLELIVRGIDEIDAATRIKFLTSNHPLNYVIPTWIDNRDTTIAILGRYGGRVILQIPLEDNIHRLNKKTPYTIYVDDNSKVMQKKIKSLLGPEHPVVGIASYGGGLVLNSDAATQNFFHTLKQHHLRFYDMREAVDNVAYTNCENEGVPYERARYNLTAQTPEGLAEQLKKYAAKATRHYRVTVWADASPTLIEALKLSTDYFQTVGISLKAIEPTE